MFKKRILAFMLAIMTVIQPLAFAQGESQQEVIEKESFENLSILENDVPSIEPEWGYGESVETELVEEKETESIEIEEMVSGKTSRAIEIYYISIVGHIKPDGTGIEYSVVNNSFYAINVALSISATGYSEKKTVQRMIGANSSLGFTVDMPMLEARTTYTIDYYAATYSGNILGNRRESISASLSNVGAFWHQGTYYSSEESLNNHFRRHKHETGNRSVVQYYYDSISFRQIALLYPGRFKITNSAAPTPSKKYKDYSYPYTFIFLANSDNRIVTFGAR